MIPSRLIMLAMIAFAAELCILRLLHANDDIEALVKKKTRELLAHCKIEKGKKIAIVNKGNDVESNAIGGFVKQTVIKDERFQIVEREALKPVLKELELQQTGLTNSALAASVGRLTPAQFVLIIDKDYINVSLSIVSVENGEVMSYVYFPLREIAADATGNKPEPVIDRSKYHSPVLASLVSIFPVWSGSWNAQFTEAGMFFVTVKSFSTLPLAYFYSNLIKNKHSVYKLRYNVNRYLFFIYYYYGESAFQQYVPLGILMVQNQKRYPRHARSLYYRWGRYSAYIWAGATAIDIIFSGIYIAWWNKKYAYITESGEVRPFLISCEVSLNGRHAEYGMEQSVEGVNVGINLRF